MMNDWDVVNEQIERSKIKRFPYKKMIGESLTTRIHRLRNKGHTSDEVKEILGRTIGIKEYIEENPHLAGKLLENITISVSARFGENKTAEKLKLNQEVKQ